MNNDRAFLRHDVLNMITLVNFSVSETVTNEKKREAILEQLKVIGLLVAKQELLLGTEKKFAKSPVSVAYVFELVTLILEKYFKKKKTKLLITPTELTFKGDTKVIKEGLEQILLEVSELSKKIEVLADERARKIKIKYDSDKKLNSSKEHPFELLRKQRSNREILFRTAVYLMELSGIKVDFKKGLVEIVLPS